MERAAVRVPGVGLALLALAGCEPAVNITIRPSDWVPSAFRAEWDGPAGRATLWVADGAADAADDETEWRVLTAQEVEAGRAGLPIALLPVGRDYSVRVELESEGAEAIMSEAATVTMPAAPDVLGFPQIEFVDEARSELAAGGYSLVNRYAGAASASEAIEFILDGQGEVVWWMAPQPTGHRVVRGKLSRDLRSALILEGESGEGDDYINRVALDGESSVDTIAPGANHDFHENGDGTLTWLAYERAEAGTIPDIPYPVVADALVTGVEGATDASQHRTGFSFLDDFPAEPEILCEHQELGEFITGAVEWTHANSVVRTPTDDGFLVMTRSLDALLMIDDSGRRVWQLGGREATLTPTAPEALFQHAHMSDAWQDDEGALRVLIFDNGNHRPEPITSRVIELRPEGDEVWRLQSEERLGRVVWVPSLGI
ncbi:hypothetical protein LBMAG42_38740 [Deltaproteobacteria bacterium]|nr:hypothetical protein LBMAG42_38740 [Deltaproteobacteria bacterium]